MEPEATATFTVAPKTGLAAGTYNEAITVSTDHSITAIVNVSFKVNGAFTVEIDPSSATIVNGNSQMLTVNPTGGSESYTYKWYAGTGTEVLSTEKSYTVSPSTTTTYKVVVNDTIEDKEVSATITVNPRIEYKIIEGANGTWTSGSDGTLTIRGDGDFDKFQDVKVDGTVIARTNYTAKLGSSIVVLKSDYLKTLSVGNHSFEMVWTDGVASTTFTIQEATVDASTPNKTDSPTTGDNINVIWWIALILVSGIGIVVFSRKRRTR